MRVTKPDKGGRSYVFLLIALAFAAFMGWAIAAGAYLSVVQQSVIVLGALGCVFAACVVHIHYMRNDESSRNIIAEQRLRESEERLRQAQKMEAIGQLAGGIAHDFNNLVTVIGCSVGLLAEATDTDDPRQEDLQQIKEAADRAASLTRQLLTFSRRQIVQPKAVDLNSVVFDMEKMLQRVLGTHISIRTSLDPKLVPVLVDVGQIEQVIMNLAVNARDAMPTGGVLQFSTANVSLDTEIQRPHGRIPAGEYVALVVQDSGQGMPPSVMEHLFEPFFTTKEQGKGTGLGLATVHGIVKQADGHITVASKPGQGTMWTLYFPRARGERATTPPEAREAIAAAVQSSTQSPPQPKRSTILVVDDEEAILDIGVRVLEQAGFQVFAARHGDEALSILSRSKKSGKPISLVLTDVVMPMMGGRELATTVSARYPETRVLCMSGYTRDELNRQQLIDPYAALVHKPFEVAEPTKAVRSTLDRSGTAAPTTSTTPLPYQSRHDAY